MKAWIVPFILLVLSIADVQGQQWRVNPHTIALPDIPSGTSYYTRIWNMDTGAVTGGTWIANRVGSGGYTHNYTFTTTNSYRFGLVYAFKSINNYAPFGSYHFVMVVPAYKVGGEGPQENGEPWDVLDPYTGGEGSGTGTLQPPAGTDMDGIVPPSGSSAPGLGEPPPVDPGPGDPGPGPGDPGGPGMVQPGEGGEYDAPAPGLERYHKAELRLSNTTGGIQKYLVTLKTNIGQLLKQQIITLQPHSSEILVEWNEQPIQFEGQLVYQANPDGPPDTTPGPTIEGTTEAWNVPSGQPPGTVGGGGTTSQVPGVAPGSRSEGNDPNAEARHAEAQEARRRIEAGIKDAASTIKDAIEKQTSELNAEAEEASMRIKNSIEFANGVLVDSLSQVKGAVDGVKEAVEDIDIDVTEPEPEPGDEHDELAAAPDLPGSDAGAELQSAVDAGAGGLGETLDNILAAGASLHGSIVSLMQSLGLDTTVTQDTWVWDIHLGPPLGTITINAESAAGTVLDWFRALSLFAMSLWFVQHLVTFVREAFAN